MIPATTFVTMFFTLTISFVLPILLFVILAAKKKISGVAVIWGSLGFIVPQLIVRIPLLSLQPVSAALGALPPVVTALVLAFTAGLFESVGRLAVFKLLLKGKEDFKDGFAAGLGHGGIEAIVLVGFSYINNISYALVVNTGDTEVLVSFAGGNSELANLIANTLITTPTSMYLAAGIERLFTMGFHIFLSVLLLYMIRKGRTLYGFVYILLMHTIVDFVVPLAAGYGGIWAAEAVLGVVFGRSVFGIYKMYIAYKNEKATE